MVLTRIFAVLLALVALPASADHTIGWTVWRLYQGSTIIQDGFTTLQACAQAADNLNVLRSYHCATNRVPVNVTADAVTPPPPPPDEPPPPPPPPPTGSEPYPLGVVPFSYSWPSPPVTSRTIQVNTMAQFQSAVQTNGARVEVAPGVYTGTLNVSGSDLDVVMSNMATCRGCQLNWGNYATVVRPARVRWTGGNFVDGGLVLMPIDDLLVNDVHIDNLASNSPEGIHNLTGSVGSYWTGQGVRQGWNRQAWINSTIRLRGGSSSGGWAFFSNPHGASSAFGNGNLILANVKVQTTGGQNNRFMAITNLVIVDSVFNPDGLSANGMRIHQSTTNVYMRDSWVRGLWKLDPTNGSDFGPQVLNATFLRVAHYDQALDVLMLQGVSPNRGTVTDSVVYSNAGGGTPSVSPMTGSGNRHLPWDGVTVPNYSAVGARR
jgi:hypothetical protein